LGLGRQYPNQNFIGVDIKGSRIWKGSSSATAEGIHTVAFLRTQIQQLQDFFAPGEISELWITFPDPFPRDGDEKRRLTSPKFLEMYKQLVKAGGLIHFKTDNTGLYEYTDLVLKDRPDCQIHFNTADFYESELRDAHHGIKTRYEKIFSDKGEKIKYIQFSFTE
jgi:tRNA (guanine-N7-)-methyltransferase